ncbi:hypothetical protein [Rhodococcus triatomae]|nr:hypothetical protein G419_22604 [Rhodococcus triatomae BKS 15-14]
MNDHLHACSDFVTAMFSRGFVEDGVTRVAVERIHRGEIGEWIRALAWSGLFSNLAVANAARAWRHDPRALLDALLGDADEVTARRYDALWRSVDASTALASATAVNE